MENELKRLIETAVKKRTPLIQEPYTSAFRLINGFVEDVPNIIVEIFGKTLVYQDYHDIEANHNDQDIRQITTFIRELLPWIQTVVVKKRRSERPAERNGYVLFGEKVDKRIQENNVSYALDLMMNRDTSFYLDTRHLREWVKTHLAGKTVLNTFAYTGSIGVAALAGGASEVTHLDLNRLFLLIAQRSSTLNGKQVDKRFFQTGDFWSRIQHYKQEGQRFDCVILDPPVYSKTPKGTIDIAKNYDRVINKVRPIINDGGYLITINNALFQSGQDHQNELLALCKDGYLSIDCIIPVPFDCVGNPENTLSGLPANPAPYNHPTKITVLKVKRKDAKN